jgi:hypothetical protein
MGLSVARTKQICQLGVSTAEVFLGDGARSNECGLGVISRPVLIRPGALSVSLSPDRGRRH